MRPVMNSSHVAEVEEQSESEFTHHAESADHLFPLNKSQQANK